MTANFDDMSQRHNMAKRILVILEEQAAAYTTVNIPPHLKIQLDEKRNEVASLESRINQVSGENFQKTPNNLPRKIDFIGREDEIVSCLKALSPSENGWGVMIDGIGGMGKTALAIQVAHLAYESAMFDAYIFETAKSYRLTPDGIIKDKVSLHSFDDFVRKFSIELGYDDISREGNPTERGKRLLERLRGRQVLLIWDNLETLPADERVNIIEFLRLLPPPNKAIVTSRRRTGEIALTIRLDSLTESTAYRLIELYGKNFENVKQEWQKTNIQERKELYTQSGGNPLVLRQIAAYIEQRGYTVEQIIKLLRKAGLSEDIYGYLFADIVGELNSKQQLILSALSAMHSANLETISQMTGFTVTEVRSSLDGLITFSIVNDPDDNNKYSLHSLFKNYAQIDQDKENAQSSSIFASFTMDVNVHRKMADAWLKYLQEHEDADEPDYLNAEWQNIEATITSLYNVSGLPVKIKDSDATRMLLEFTNLLCDEDGPLINLGYWLEFAKLCVWGYEASEKTADWGNAALYSSLLSMIYVRLEEQELAKTWYEKMRYVQEKISSFDQLHFSKRSARIAGLLAKITDNPETALEPLNEALEYYKENGDLKNQIRVLEEIGQVYHKKNQTKSAEGKYIAALNLAQGINSKNLQIKIHNDLGDLHLRYSPVDLVMEWIRDNVLIDFTEYSWWLAIPLAIVEIPLLLATWGILAAGSKFLGFVSGTDTSLNPDKARPHYINALEISRTTRNILETARAQHGLAMVLNQEKRYKEAIEFAEKALHIYRDVLRGPKIRVEAISKLIEELSLKVL